MAKISNIEISQGSYKDIDGLFATNSGGQLKHTDKGIAHYSGRNTYFTKTLPSAISNKVAYLFAFKIQDYLTSPDSIGYIICFNNYNIRIGCQGSSLNLFINGNGASVITIDASIDKNKWFLLYLEAENSGSDCIYSVKLFDKNNLITTVSGTKVSHVFSSLTDVTFGRWVTTNYGFTGHITMPYIFNDYLTTKQLEKYLVEFRTLRPKHLNPRPDNYINGSKYITEIIKKDGLAGGYRPHRGTVSNGTLLDISGNSEHITYSGGYLKDNKLIFKGSGSGTSKNYGTIKGVAFRIIADTTTEYLGDLNATQSIDINAGTVRANNVSSPTIYVNGVESSTIQAGIENSIVIDFNEEVNASAFTLNKVGANYGDVEYIAFDVFTYYPTLQDAKDYHNSFIQNTYKDNTQVNSAVGEHPRDYIRGDGTYTTQEYVIERGELLSTSWLNTYTGDKFDTFTSTDYSSLEGTRVAVGNPRTKIVKALTIGKKYRLKMDRETINVSTVILTGVDATYNGQSTLDGGSKSIIEGSNSIEFTITGAIAGLMIIAVCSGNSSISLTNISLTEIPPLPQITNGTKIIQCDNNGTIILNVSNDEFIDNGYATIYRYNGGSWTKHQDTVSNLTSESWFAYSNNQVTLTGVAGDKFKIDRFINQQRV